MADLGHQRAYLRKTLHGIQRDLLDLQYAIERAESSYREISSKVADALAYTKELSTDSKGDHP